MNSRRKTLPEKNTKKFYKLLILNRLVKISIKIALSHILIKHKVELH